MSERWEVGRCGAGCYAGARGYEGLYVSGWLCVSHGAGAGGGVMERGKVHGHVQDTALASNSM